VTKSSKCGYVVCGRLGDGIALHVFGFSASRESYEPAWTPYITSDDVFDSDNQSLPWRYISNAKVSFTKEFCGIYLKDVVYPAMGRPKPR